MERWIAGPAQPRATPEEVHVWLATVDQFGDRLGELAATLAPDEQARAKRFVFDRDRVRFSVARGCLRAILGRYLQMAPAAIAFRYNDFGKPEIADAENLTFNLSHSSDLVLCAVTRHRRLGIDVERIRTMGAEAIVERYFTPAEQQTLATLPLHERLRAFFNGWTRKEAWLKAMGRGIGMGLDQVDVSLACVERPEIRSIGNDVQAATAWSLASFDPAEDAVAAVACDGTLGTMRFYNLGID